MHSYIVLLHKVWVIYSPFWNIPLLLQVDNLLASVAYIPLLTIFPNFLDQTTSWNCYSLFSWPPLIPVNGLRKFISTASIHHPSALPRVQHGTCDFNLLNQFVLLDHQNGNTSPFNYSPLQVVSMKLGKQVKLSLNRPWRPIWLQVIEAPTFSWQSANRWCWGCQHYAPATLYPHRVS
jgi:hypothetical protein